MHTHVPSGSAGSWRAQCSEGESIDQKQPLCIPHPRHAHNPHPPPPHSPPPTTRGVQAHLAESHPRCDFCARRFYDDDGLWKHMQQVRVQPQAGATGMRWALPSATFLASSLPMTTQLSQLNPAQPPLLASYAPCHPRFMHAPRAGALQLPRVPAALGQLCILQHRARPAAPHAVGGCIPLPAFHELFICSLHSYLQRGMCTPHLSRMPVFRAPCDSALISVVSPAVQPRSRPCMAPCCWVVASFLQAVRQRRLQSWLPDRAARQTASFIIVRRAAGQWPLLQWCQRCQQGGSACLCAACRQD